MSADFAVALGGSPAPLTRMRRAASRQMMRAWTAPAFSVSAEVDMTGLLTQSLPGVTITDRLIGSTAVALQRNPGINSWFIDDDVVTFKRAHVAIAVATTAGLVVPVVRDAQDLDVVGISQARAELVARAREQSLSMDDVTGGTFTITNLGMFGVSSFTAILNPPQVAILAVGTIFERFRRREGEASWRHVAELTLTCDHRAVDGAQASAFLADLTSLIETVES